MNQTTEQIAADWLDAMLVLDEQPHSIAEILKCIADRYELPKLDPTQPQHKKVRRYRMLSTAA